MWEHARIVPPLSRRRNPTVALIVGFLFGGVGLAIYFRSLLDGILAVTVFVVSTSQFAASGSLATCAIIGIWGYLRAHSSNARLDAAEARTDLRSNRQPSETSA